MPALCLHRLLPCVSVFAIFLFVPPGLAQKAETLMNCTEPEALDDQAEPQCCMPNLMKDVAAGKICVKQPSPESVAVAITLIFSFTFLISLQYFMNSLDVAMREVAYKVISSTVSIFSAVLTFQSLYGVVEDLIIEPLQKRIGFVAGVDLVVDFVHMLLWYATTQITIAVVSKALESEEWRKEELREAANPESRRTFTGLSDRNLLVARRLSKRHQHEHTNMMLDIEINSVCYGMVLAHLTGFASIEFWTEVQLTDQFKGSPLQTLIPIPMALLAQLCLERLVDRCREVYIVFKGDKDWFERTWDKKCKEAEDDIMGLTMSVMIVNSLRYAINESFGHTCLPNSEQKEEGTECEFQHSLQEACWLYGFGVFFVILLFATKKFFVGSLSTEDQMSKSQSLHVKMLVLGELDEQEEEKTCSAEFAERMQDVIITTWSMAHAWCALHGTRQLLMVMSPEFLGKESHTTTLAVVLATGVTYIVFMTVWFLDTLSDLPEEWKEWVPPEVEESIKTLIRGTSIFVGFAWEQTFDVTVDQLAETTRARGGPHAPAIAKLVIGSGCIVVVFFAWKWHILPFVFKKGWRYGYVFSRNDLHDRCHELATHDKHFNIDHLHSIAQELAEVSAFHKNRFDITNSSLLENRCEPLLGSEVEALSQENQDLKLRIRDLEDQLEERKAGGEWKNHRKFLEQQLAEERKARLDIQTYKMARLERQSVKVEKSQTPGMHFKKNGESLAPSLCTVKERVLDHTTISGSESPPSKSSRDIAKPGLSEKNNANGYFTKHTESATLFSRTIKEGAFEQFASSKSKPSASPPELSKQPQLVTAHRPPLMCHRSPVTDHRSSFISDWSLQSPVTSHRSPVSNHRSPVSDCRSSAFGQQSQISVTCHPSLVTRHRSPVTGHRSLVTGHQDQVRFFNMASDEEGNDEDDGITMPGRTLSPQQGHLNEIHENLHNISVALHARLSAL